MAWNIRSKINETVGGWKPRVQCSVGWTDNTWETRQEYDCFVGRIQAAWGLCEEVHFHFHTCCFLRSRRRAIPQQWDAAGGSRAPPTERIHLNSEFWRKEGSSVVRLSAASRYSGFVLHGGISSAVRKNVGTLGLVLIMCQWKFLNQYWEIIT